MDLRILLNSDKGLRRKFSLTIVILTLTIVATSLLVFLNANLQLISFKTNVYPKLIFFSLFIIPIFLLKLVRWRFICSEINLKIPLKIDTKCWIESQAFLATPGGSGLGIRAILLKEKYNIPFSIVIPAIIFERLIDLISVLVIILIFNIKDIIASNIIIPVIISIIISIIIYRLNPLNLINKISIILLPSSI